MLSDLILKNERKGGSKTHECQVLHNFCMVHRVQSAHICTWTCDTDHKLKDMRGFKKHKTYI